MHFIAIGCISRCLSRDECVSDCMFVLLQAGGSTGLLMDLAANEKAVHPDFFNGEQSLYSILYKPKTLSNC